MTGARSSNEFVWKNITNDMSGWTSPGIAFEIGLLPIAFPITAFDGVLHMSRSSFRGVVQPLLTSIIGKEVKQPKRNVPRAMVFAVLLNSIMQFVWLVVVMYRIGDLDNVNNAPFGMAIIGVYMNATNSKPVTTLFVIFQLLILFTSLFNIFASVSRLPWAFSQNNDLPFSKFFAFVSPTKSTLSPCTD